MNRSREVELWFETRDFVEEMRKVRELTPGERQTRFNHDQLEGFFLEDLIIDGDVGKIYSEKLGVVTYRFEVNQNRERMLCLNFSKAER